MAAVTWRPHVMAARLAARQVLAWLAWRFCRLLVAGRCVTGELFLMIVLMAMPCLMVLLAEFLLVP